MLSPSSPPPLFMLLSQGSQDPYVTQSAKRLQSYKFLPKAATFPRNSLSGDYEGEHSKKKILSFQMHE